MSDKFKSREASEEAKFKLDAELRFKVEARRNRKLGEWAADKLGMLSTEKDAFVKDVVASDLVEAGYEDVVRTVSKTFKDRGVEIDDGEIRIELERLQDLAEDEVRGEYPEPLGGDHAKVGD